MYYAKEEILLVISITPLAATDITAAATPASSSSLSSIENGMDKKQDDNIKVSLYNANRERETERQTDSSGPTKPSATVTLTVSPRDLNDRPAALPVPLAY